MALVRAATLPTPVVERARAARHGQGGALGEALAALDAERARLGTERAALQRQVEAAAKAEARARAAEAAARTAQQEAAARLGDAVVEELEAARAEVAELLSSLQAQPTVRKATEAAAQLDAWKNQVAGAAKVAEAKAATAEEALPGGELRPGVRVRIASLGQEGQVLEVDGKQAMVQAGPLKVRRPLADLVPLTGQARQARLAVTAAERMAAAAEARPDAPRIADRRLDVRGLRVEELLREVERFLDRLYSEGEKDCLVLHGRGTGALKQALRDALGASPYVGSYRPGAPEEGGDAATLIVFRR
jgi:DNA mismatch repair protein MutS2